ncbi:MAG: ABC transporter permease [Firmicutes bacterium HGW-Firmicutes-1]|jgi:polar amino acid transport system permease protein|nr:MAG: ABC transporter permease [Firmicutes bacterium HGW-Firmicutes-1]
MTKIQALELFKGSITTIELTILAVVIGLFFGMFLALGRISRNKIMNGICWIYIWIFRGTPLLLQIYVIYFALPSIGIKFDAFPAAIVALSLNSAAYLAEIIRAAIQSIDKGQMEASKALGMSYYQAMFKIIIPQSYRRLIPPVGNEAIMLLKDSSLVSVMGMTELLRSSKLMANASREMYFYFIAGAIYLFFTTIFTIIFQKLEQKYSVYE